MTSNRLEHPDGGDHSARFLARMPAAIQPQAMLASVLQGVAWVRRPLRSFFALRLDAVRGLAAALVGLFGPRRVLPTPDGVSFGGGQSAGVARAPGADGRGALLLLAQ